MIQAFAAAGKCRRSDLARSSGEAMSTALSGTPFASDKIGDFAKDLRVQTAILDRSGVIVATNEQWQRLGKARRPAHPEYGSIGDSYFRNCAFADPLSPRLIRGLAQVTSGEIERLSIVYSWNDPCDGRQHHVLLLAFPHPEISDHIVVMHVDVSVLTAILTNFPRKSAGNEPAGNRSGSSTASAAGGTEDALRALIAEATMENVPHLQMPRKDRHPVLSRRQSEVLARMTKGMSNAEIAQDLGLSLNTVKVHVSGILARLGMQSRAQVLHWALAVHPADDGV